MGVRKLPSGFWQARYQWKGVSYTAPTTFRTKGEGTAWIEQQKTLHRTGTFAVSQAEDRRNEEKDAKTLAGAEPFQQYALRWIEERTNAKGQPLAEKTKNGYYKMVKTGRLVDFAQTPIASITPEMVRTWRAEHMKSGAKTSVTRHYQLLSAVLHTAEVDDIIQKCPCTIRGAASTSTGKRRDIPTDREVEKLIDAAAPWPQWQTVIRLGASGGFRVAEILALTTNDVVPLYPKADPESPDPEGLLINIDKSVKQDAHGKWVSTPGTKSEAGIRQIHIYGQDVPSIWEFISSRPDGPIWTQKDGSAASYFTFRSAYEKIRKTVDLENITFHALRHYSGTHYAQSSRATLAEIKARLGHSTTSAAMRYQHAGNRSEELARLAAR